MEEEEKLESMKKNELLFIGEYDKSVILTYMGAAFALLAVYAIIQSQFYRLASDLQRPIFPSDLSGMSMAGAWFLCLGVAVLVSFADLSICLQLSNSQA